MRGGPRVLAILLLISLLMGIFVIMVHPSYRDTALCILRGESDMSAVWVINEDYYPEISLTPERNTDVTE